MPERLKALIKNWNGLGVVVRYDAPTDTWIFICLHSSRGPATGGTRLKTYPTLADGLEDAMRLAEGMTQKWAVIDQPFGGGKAVLAVPGPLTGDERRGLLLRYGALVESLRGGFLTGEDLGTTSDDMKVIAEATQWVHGFDAETGLEVDPSPYTALGVYRGLQAALEREFGTTDPEGRTCLIEGVGNVGLRLAEKLAAAGARVLLSDIDEARANAAADRLGGAVVAPGNVYSTECDVYSPCAVGATVNRETIPALRCRIVAGSANNQLAEPEDADRLAERGILYVPDYVINGGGALSFALLGMGVEIGDELAERMDAIGAIVREILAEAAVRGESPIMAAHRRVRRTLSKPPAPA